jgi:hypothetical protein
MLQDKPHIKKVHSIIVSYKSEATKAITLMKNLPGSDGSIIKSYDGLYHKNSESDAWIKLISSDHVISDDKAIENKEGDNDEKLWSSWSELVNMSASELKSFMDSDEGKQAGLSKEEADKEGIKSGRESAEWILKMLPLGGSYDEAEEKWTPAMWEWAGRQVSFISRMKGVNGPLYDDKGNKTRKHLALLIWGHNPEKKLSSTTTDTSGISDVQGKDIISKKEVIIPTPQETETRNQFIARCMSDDSMQCCDLKSRYLMIENVWASKGINNITIENGGGFYMPEILKVPVVSELDDNNLIYYHDQSHTLWEKLKEGYALGWNFIEIAHLHISIIGELSKRKIPHIMPINELDKVFYG